MTTITRERLLKIQQWRETYGTGSNVMLPAEEAEELARIALASLEAEPVSQPYKLPEEKGASLQLRNLIRKRHAEWSDSTFGNVGPVGPLKHLSKEALEAAAEPGDLSEWADMQFLLWDAQRRAGISDGEITAAMEEKLKVNMARQWPEPKDGEPRLHIKEQPVPVVPAEMPKGLAGQIVSLLAHNIGDKFLAQKIWNACRAALLQGSQPVSNCDELQVIGWLRSDYNSDDKRDHNAPLFMLGSNDPSEAWGVKYIPLSGNSPVIPDGYALVPVEPTDEMIEAAMNCDDVTYNKSDDTVFYVHHREIYKAMLAAAPQQGTTNL